uniref:uncharacterized protein LOC100175000 n=1 Tax=Ciona intestinalis TaxID=7719 RepID=UPI000EF52E48|nr:uncharacterized protein LOC100175000 [Ciona intestinalis]|eukprot:XP_026694750.1 uncharacterized protein LOC100175000 [Ciona intestinalis]
MLDLFSDNQYWKPPLPDISVDIQYLPVQNQNKTKDNNVHHNDVACTKATELLVVENCYCSQLNLSDQSNKKNQYMMAPCGLYYHSANPESNSSSLYTEDSLHTSSQKKPNELFKRKCAYCVTAAKFQGNNNNSNNNSNALELISRASTKSAKSDTLQLNPSYDRLLSVKSTCGKSMGNTESNNGRRYNLITSDIDKLVVGKSKGHSHNKRSLQTSGRSKSLSTKRKELQITDDGFCLTTKSSRLLDRVKSEDEITFEVVPESKKSSKPQSHVKSLLSNEHEEISTEQRRLEDVAKEVVNSVVVDAEVNMLVGGPSPVLYDGGTPCYCNMAQRSLVDVSTNSTFSGETLLNWLLCGGKYKDNCNDVFVTEFCEKLLKCGILRTQTNIPGAKFKLNGLYKWFEPTQRYKSTSEPNLEQLPSEPKNMKRNSLPSEKQQRLPTTVQSKLNSYISVADLSSITTTSPNEGFRNNSNRLKTNIDQSSIATQTEVSFSE